jgi:uncharacterized membrane protein
MELIKNPGFVILGSCGFIFFISGLIQLKFPPKDINSLYGYRTKSSMKSKEAWNFAQKYSAKISIWIGTIMILLGIVSFLFPIISNDFQVLISLLIIFISVGLLIFSTEKKLKQKFQIK